MPFPVRRWAPREPEPSTQLLWRPAMGKLFLKLPGVRGDATAPGHEGESEIESLEVGRRPGDNSKPQFQFTVTLDFIRGGRILPQLHTMLKTRFFFYEAVVTLGDDYLAYYGATIESITVNSYNSGRGTVVVF